MKAYRFLGIWIFGIHMGGLHVLQEISPARCPLELAVLERAHKSRPAFTMRYSMQVSICLQAKRSIANEALVRTFMALPMATCSSNISFSLRT